MKVTVVGAGNVGATSADVLAFRKIASEVVLLDIRENFAEGKALDMMQTATLNGFDSRVSGIMVVSPCPPITIPSISFGEAFNASDK